jgi:hypothetical protein
MTKTQRIKEIKQEIKWYAPKKRIADTMLELGELGFKFSGHGCGFGREDFGLIHPNYHHLYVSLSDIGSHIEVMVDYIDEDDNDECFVSSVGQATKLIKGIL